MSVHKRAAEQVEMDDEHETNASSPSKRNRANSGGTADGPTNTEQRQASCLRILAFPLPSTPSKYECKLPDIIDMNPWALTQKHFSEAGVNGSITDKPSCFAHFVLDIDSSLSLQAKRIVTTINEYFPCHELQLTDCHIVVTSSGGGQHAEETIIEVCCTGTACIR